MIEDCHRWLNENIGPDGFAKHGTESSSGEAKAFYFRDLDNARDFMSAFPSLRLADGTLSVSYSSPVHDGVWQSSELFGLCNLY